MDINDAAQAGYSVEDLLDAAEAEQPLPAADSGRATKRGLDLLIVLAEKIRVAQSKEDSARHIAEAQLDAAGRRDMGYAYSFRPGDVLALIEKMTVNGQTQRGLGEQIKRFSRAIILEAKSVAETETATEIKEHTRRIGKLKGLSVDAAKLSCPQGWRVTDDGVYDSGGKVIANMPILIIGQHRDQESDVVRVTVAWREEGREEWREATVDRGMIVNSRKVIELGLFGAPVNSGNAANLVSFFSDFEKENRMTPTSSIGRMGWVGETTFVYGNVCLGDQMKVSAVGSDRTIIGRYRPSGTMLGWLDAIRTYVVDRPLVLIGLYASAASVLLHPLKRPGFVVDWSGDSSRGKTKSLEVAASLWGQVDEESGILQKWESASTSAPLHLAWLMQSLPLIMDETKQGKPEVIRSMLYAFGSGADKMRGQSDGGVRETRRWRAVLLSTGEAPITTFGRDQGARARCILLNGAPFGKESEENRVAAEAMKSALQENHGHMGPMLVQWLLDNRAQWPDLRRRYKEAAAKFAGRFTRAMSMRIAEHIAVIQIAAELLHALGLPGTPDAAIEAIVASVKSAEPDADQSKKAIEHLYSWSAANQSKFYGRIHGEREPPGGWVGAWAEGVDWDWIGYRPEVLARVLHEGGYNVEDVKSSLRTRDLLVLDEDGLDPRQGINASRLACVKKKGLLSR